MGLRSASRAMRDNHAETTTATARLIQRNRGCAVMVLLPGRARVMSFLQGCAQEETTRIAFLCDVDHEYAKAFGLSPNTALRLPGLDT